jgi:2-desacetyl-2-hydroxyethyl bacteriochlorophyllide A dehydrogenase
MKRQSVYFTSPGELSIREEIIPPLQPGQVLVQTLLSAISPGTEMLIYRGQFPAGLAADDSISALAGELAYPLKYGYSAVGRVIGVGSAELAAWEGQTVFSFHPHESHFIASPGELMPLPEGLPLEDAVFLPNMETAVNFVMDGSPLIGERVLVFGQGIVGLLAAGLLSRFPLACLATLDRFALRRQASIEAGAHHSLDPDAPETGRQLERLFPGGADLTYELSGSPAALDQAIACTGFEGRVIVGSWYGQKRASLDLGGKFHRSRIRLISSQVSTLASAFSGRWTKDRRFEVAWEMLRRARPSHLITQRFSLAQAALAYEQIDSRSQETIQVVLEYNSG